MNQIEMGVSSQGGRVLVTGAMGYIASRLVPKLMAEGYQVRGFDSVAGEASEFVTGDIRDRATLYPALDGVEAVIHLAALVSVPRQESKKEAELIREINHLATCRLVDWSKEKGVSRFIFSSTCGNYGVTDGYATEESPLSPTSGYGEAKAKAEEYVLAAADTSFHPIVLRLATVFGPSPRMSFQPLLNALVKDAVEGKPIELYGAGSWRPFLHIEDAVQALLLVLRASVNLVSGQVFNVGSVNCQKSQLASLIKKHLPQSKIEVREGAPDPRSYRVSFDKIARVLGSAPGKNLEEGVAELIKELEGCQLAR